MSCRTAGVGFARPSNSAVVAETRTTSGYSIDPEAMSGKTTGGTTMRLASWGHAAFAATMVGFGILGLMQGNFTPIWTGVPKGMPARAAVAYLCAFISLGSGLGLLWPRAAAVASRVLLLYLLLWMLLFRVPLVFKGP